MAGAAEEKVVVEGEAVAEAAAEVRQAMLRHPPVVGLVSSMVIPSRMALAPCD